MPDENTPVEQEPQKAPQQQVPEGYIELARYNGLVRKVEELTIANRQLQASLNTRTSEYEQLNVQLGIKDSEKSAAVSERDRQLDETVKAKLALEGELSELRNLKLKMEVAKEMGRPDLYGVLDAMPNLSDKEALKSVVGTFAEFTDQKVRAREKELLSGITPNLSSATPVASTPTSADGWTKHIESLPLGSPERDKAMDQYWDFMSAQNS
ncbi:MAG: hypothetical protein KQI81_08955 [Deltaproteobacteria bacterium]|nr:hypothetical protein [Deltaproteobacteria bacterium]